MGFGMSPLGSAPYGWGSPAGAPVQGGIVFPDSTGTKSLDCRGINQSTGRYDFDSYGRIKGQASVPQLVQLALKTVLQSSAVRTLGTDWNALKDIGDNFAKQFDGAVRAALNSLVTQKLVAILDITSQRINTTAVFGRVRWQDLTTTLEHTSEIR